MHPKYKVKYKVLQPADICNALRENDAELIRKHKFFSELESSILEKGFINPILVNAGYCPKLWHRKLPAEMKADPSKILVCCKWGGSRLYIAQKHNLSVPCLISDFINRFNEPILTLPDVKLMLTNIREIVITDDGLWVKV